MPTLEATTNLLQLVGEPSRMRMLSLLAEQELTAAELGSVTELSQSRVSTHLGRLREAGLVREQRVAGTTYYGLSNGEMPAEVRRLWEVVAAGLDGGDQALQADRQRCAAVLRARRAAARWPDAVAGEMERHYSPGRTWEAVARGFMGLLRLGDVLDAGGGDGAITELVAPRARQVTCVDHSETLIAAARARLGLAAGAAREAEGHAEDDEADQGHSGDRDDAGGDGRATRRSFANVRCLVGDLHDLPLPASSFDQVLLLNVLASVTTPARVLAECSRLLRPGGALVLVTLAAHDHLEITTAYGHRHPGFAPPALRKMLARTGLAVEDCAVTSRERRSPYFQVLTAFASKPVGAGSSPLPPPPGRRARGRTARPHPRKQADNK